MGLFAKAFRSHPSNPDNWLLYGLSGGSQSHAGVNVTEDGALSFSAVWAGVRFIAETTASLPLHLYKRIQPRGKERANDDNRYRLMHIQPNPEMTSMIFREVLTAQAVLRGTAYAEIDREGSGKIKALWPLLTSKMKVKRVEDELVYFYTTPDGKTQPLVKNQVLRITGFGEDGITGYNVVTKHTEAIGLGMALEEYGARFFSSGGKPPIAFEHPASLSTEAQERLRKDWANRHEGLSNAHRLAILEEGMKLHEYGISPEEAQAIESRKFQNLEIARILNIAPHILKDLDRASYNSVEMLSQETVTYTLQPWATRLEQAYTTQLLNEKEQKDLFFEHLFAGLLRGDTQTRHAAYAVGRQWGYYSADDVREMENLNPIDGGDIYLIPLNMVPADQIGEQDEEEPIEPTQEEKPKETKSKRVKNQLIIRDRMMKRFLPIIKDATQRIVNKENKLIEAHKEPDFKMMPDYIRTILSPGLFSFGEMVFENAYSEVGIKFEKIDVAKDMQRFLNAYLDEFIERHLADRDDNAVKMANDEMVNLCNAITKKVLEGAGYKTALKDGFIVLGRS